MKVKLLIVVVCLISCSEKEKQPEEVAELKAQIAFDADKWKIKEDKDYVWRIQMTDSLLYTDTLRSMTEEQILSQLGEPDRRDNNYLFYIVRQQRLGFWVMNQKTLVVVLSTDGSKHKVLLKE